MKVKVPNSNFTGTSHGLKFVDGVSEDFKDKELMGRLKRKGYVCVVNKKETDQKPTEGGEGGA